MEYNRSPSFGLGARANRRASTQLTIDEEGRKPLFSKPSRESLEPQNPSPAAAGSNRFGYSPTNAQTSATGRPPSRAAIPRPSSSLSQTPSLNSNHSIEIVSPGSRIPRPKSTIGIFAKGSGVSVAEAWKLADENRVQTLEKARRATPAAIDASPSPAPRPYTNRQVSDESKSRRSLGKDAVDYSRPRPLSRMSSDSLRDSYVGRYGGSPGSNSLSSSGSFDRRLSQYEREMAESPSASRDQEHFFGKTRVGPKIAETGHTLARRTSNSSLNGSQSANRRTSNGSLNGGTGLGRRTSYGSLSASPRPGAFAKSQVPEGHIKELLEQDEKGIKRSARPKPDDDIAADTPLPSVETSRLPQEPTPPTSRPASTNPDYRSPDKSYAWQLDADFTAGDLQISDSPRIRTDGAGFSEASDRRSSYGSAYAEEQQLLGLNGNFRRESSLGVSPRAGRSDTRIDEIRQREEKAKEELAESRKALPRARNNTRLEEIREREAEAEDQLAKLPRRSYYPTPDDLPDREEVDTQAPPKNTKLDEIRAREAESLSKKAVATSRLEEIREQNSMMSRSMSPEARRSEDFARESTPVREAAGESVWPIEDGEHIANTPVTIYRNSPVRERNKSLSESPANRNERASPKSARPLGAHTRTDSRDLLQRLARAASSSPAPESNNQPAATDEKKWPSIEDLEKERLEKANQEVERLEKERRARERLERERLERERLDREKLEKERLEREKIETDRLEKEKLAKEKLEKERLEKERLEKETLEKEKLEKERLGKEKLEEEKREKLKLEMERLEKETSKETSQRAETQRRRSEARRSAPETEPKTSPPRRSRRETIKVSESASTETKGTDHSKSSSSDEPKAPEVGRPQSRVDFAARRRERRQRSTDSAKDNRKSVALSDGDPTDRIEQERNLFAPADNQSERGSRAPSAEPTTEDEDKDLAGETPRPKKVDPLSLPTPRVTGAYVETPATLKVERIEENTLPPLKRPDPSSNATFDRPQSRRGSRPTSRAGTFFKASESGSETSDQKETTGTSTTTSLRRRNRSTSRPRKPLTNSVKPPTVKDDIKELQRIHQIEDSTLDDFEELFNMQKLQNDPDLDIESMLDDIAVKKEEVAAKPNIPTSQRNHELEQYDRMSKTLKDGLFNIRSAKQGIERLEGQVSHAEGGKHDDAATLGKVSEKQPQAKGSHHRHNPDHARDCPECNTQIPIKEVSYLHLPVPSLYRRNPFRLTFLGLVLLLVSLWYAAESAMCEAYCRPTSCSSTPCVWSPTDPTWGVALPVKLDEWATGGLGRQLANQYSEEASDLWADALDFVTATDITTIDINTLDFYDKRQLRRRLRKKGLAKRTIVESASDKAKWDAWHATRVASERAQDAKEMGYDIGDADESLGDDEIFHVWGTDRLSQITTFRADRGLRRFPGVQPQWLRNYTRLLAFNAVQRISEMDGSNISSQVKANLVEKPWFGFDLDDTLHEFRRASSAATTKTLEAISDKHGTPVEELKETYGHVLSAKTAGAFSDGKTSFEYRRERFSSVLDRFGLPSNDAAFLEGLLDVYERTLNESLRLKDGAEALLKKLKGMGKKVVVITEGPQDAQERTVRALGIEGYIDFLATTNFFGVAKTEGLFGEVLRHLGIGAGEIVFVGDSVVRDVEPALREGILSVLFDERGETSWEGRVVKVKSLRDLEALFGDGGL